MDQERHLGKAVGQLQNRANAVQRKRGVAWLENTVHACVVSGDRNVAKRRNLEVEPSCAGCIRAFAGNEHAANAKLDVALLVNWLVRFLFDEMKDQLDFSAVEQTFHVGPGSLEHSRPAVRVATRCRQQ